MNDANTNLLAQLEVSRKELLDLGLRNSLLNFRSSARSLEVVDELTQQVFEILVSATRPMSFLPLPETRQAEAENVETVDFDFDEFFGEASTNESLASRHIDTKLQTRRTPDILLKTLLKIHTEAKAYLEEQGVNVLYLALGFLEWYEDDNSQTVRKAPVIPENSYGAELSRYSFVVVM